MEFQLTINTHEDLDCIESDSERADIHCNYLSDVADVYYYLTQFESSYPSLMSFDRYTFNGFSIAINNSNPNLIDDIENRIDDILLKNDVSFATIEAYEEC
ncbi:MAG: hypothetical protein IJ086_14040 [Clostridium sp.]|nr:hypothetical protein [Clostridium sp.]MBQ9072668.1 hypothetical protein [Bacilli bacterium]